MTEAQSGRRERVRTLRRRILMLLTGQVLLHRKRVPAKAKRILWYYDWSTVGDSIMDLSQRFAIPERIDLDLLMPNGPASIFLGDSRFRRVLRSADEMDGDYDLVLIQDLSTRSLSFKLKHFFATPFASVHEHLQQERFSRIDFAARRIAELFELPPFPAQPPRLPFSQRETACAEQTIAVAIGGRDPRRTYAGWAAVLEKITGSGLNGQLGLRFLLIGSGESAKQALAAIPADFLAAHCSSLLDTPDARDLVTAIAGCSAFLGADGGLMHIAAACGKPGLALFCEIRPEWRLHPDSQLATLYAPSDLNSIPPGEIAKKLLEQFVSRTETSS